MEIHLKFFKNFLRNYSENSSQTLWKSSWPFSKNPSSVLTEILLSFSRNLSAKILSIRLEFWYSVTISLWLFGKCSFFVIQYINPLEIFWNSWWNLQKLPLEFKWKCFKKTFEQPSGTFQKHVWDSLGNLSKTFLKVTLEKSWKFRFEILP